VPLTGAQPTTTVAFDGLGSDALIRRVNVNLGAGSRSTTLRRRFSAALAAASCQDPEARRRVVADTALRPSRGAVVHCCWRRHQLLNAGSAAERLLGGCDREESGSLF